MTSPVFQTSGFPIAAIIWLEKMVTMKTVYGRIKVLRVFAYLLGYVEDLKYHDLTDAGTDKPTGYCYFQFIVLSFESFFSMNFVFIKDVAVIIQSNFSRNTDNLGVKYSFAVFVSVSFSPLIRPFFALTWTSTDCKLIKYCWNRAVCQPFSSRKCLHDFFSLKVFGAYMQVLDGRELLISATTEGASFLS